MTLHKIDLSAFGKTSTAEWETQAKKQLKTDSLDKLEWSPFEGISNKPYYDASDLEGLEDQLTFFKKCEKTEWGLVQEIKVSDEGSANGEAQIALKNGCDGVLFASDHSEIDTQKLFSNLDSKSISCLFPNYQSEEISGLIVEQAGFSNCFEAPSLENPIETLANTLQNIDKKHLIRTSYQDFFFEVCYLRALRYLAAKKAKAFSIHTKIPTIEAAKNQLFLSSTASIAAICGGTNSLVFSTTQSNERTIRNIGNIVREESKIMEGNDQLGGSYYVEALTQQIISKTLEII